MIRLPFALLVALAVAGCTAGASVTAPEAPPAPPTPAEPAVGFPNHNANAIAAYVTASTAAVRSFRAESRLEFQTARRTDRVGAGLRGRLADSLVVTVRGPLGIEAGRGVVTADSVLGHDKINGRLYVGPASAADRYVPGAGSPEALARNLLGLLVPESGPGWSVRTDAGRYRIASAGDAQVYLVDPAQWRVVSYEERGPGGEVLARRLFEEFEEVEGGGVVAMRVVLSSPPDGVTVTAEHREVVVNPPDLRLRFERPRRAEIRRID